MPEFALPPRGVLAAEEVDRLLRATVVLEVADRIALEPERMNACALDRTFVDPRRDRTACDPDVLGCSEVDGDDSQGRESRCR